MPTKYLVKFQPSEANLEICLDANRSVSVMPCNTTAHSCVFSGTTAVYKNLWNDVDVEYKISDSQLKENIYIQSQDGAHELEFKISGYGLCFYDSGDIHFFCNQRSFLYTIQAPFLLLANGELIRDASSIRHVFCEKTGSYKIQIGTFPADCYPILVDPTFNFDAPDNYFEPENIFGGASKGKLILSGFDEAGVLKLDPSGIEQHGDKLIRNGDAITFNSKINAYLEFLDGSDDINEITYVKVRGRDKVKTVLSDSQNNLEEFQASLSPAFLYAKVDATRQNQYKIKLTLSENTKNAKSLSVNSEIKAPTTQLPYGTLLNPAGTQGADKTSYTFTFETPAVQSFHRGVMTFHTVVTAVFSLGGQDKTLTHELYSFVQLVTETNKEPFNFREDSGKVDPINGDYYAPTTNRGLVIIDVSLGSAVLVDSQCFLSDTNVYCAGRVNIYTDQQSTSSTTSGGIMICTTNGIYFFYSPPFAQTIMLPQNSSEMKRISGMKIIDFTISGTNVFMLGEMGEVYRVGYLQLLSAIASGKVDTDVFNTTQMPFHESNALSSTVYAPAADGLPQKILPIAIRAETSHSSYSTAYFTAGSDRWKGAALIYKGRDGKKTIAAVAYAPLSATYTVATAQKERDLNRVIFVSNVSASVAQQEQYKMTKMGTEDKPILTLDWDKTKDDTSMFNYPIMYIPPAKNSTTRVIIGCCLPSSGNNLTTLEAIRPPRDKFYMCPRNVVVVDVEEYGARYDPITGQEVK